jgi:hypothetical protein
MAVNRSRDVAFEFHEGITDNTYMQLCPNRVAVENPPVDRLTWPTYAQVERHREDPAVDMNPYGVAEIHTRGTQTNRRWY